jgi:hypothetical protein
MSDLLDTQTDTAEVPATSETVDPEPVWHILSTEGSLSEYDATPEETAEFVRDASEKGLFAVDLSDLGAEDA